MVGALLKTGTAALAARQLSALGSLSGAFDTVTGDVGKAISDIASGSNDAASAVLTDAAKSKFASTQEMAQHVDCFI